VTDPWTTFIAIAPFISGLCAGSLSFVAARNRSRRSWPWAIAAFLLTAPAIFIVQAVPPSRGSQASGWWPRLILAGSLVAASVLIDAVPLHSHRIAAFEARTAASWFSDRTVLADGAILRAANAGLEFSGNPERPVILGLVGAALGVLILHRTVLSTIALGLIGAALGAAAWLGTSISAAGHWLQNPTQTPVPPTGYSGAAFVVLLWIAVGCAWLGQRRHGAA
jgi:hypothetical protein